MEEKPTYHLEPGYIYVSRSGHVIRTVLGSCVSICIWDKKKKIGGMNHFLYPRLSEGEYGTTKYGNIAIPALINIMKDSGCKEKNMIVQIYGGSNRSGGKNDNSTPGGKNISIARKMIEMKGLSVDSEDVGGKMGRKLLFDTSTGHVAVLKVHELRRDDWFEK